MHTQPKPFRIVAPTFTPFTDSGAINLSVIPAYADYLRSKGISDVFINGTTGEGASLSVAEQGELISAWMAAAGQDIAVIVHVGHASIAEASGLARRAQDEGAAAIAALPPFYFRPNSIARLVATMAEVAAGAPALPFYYYHIPSMTGVMQPMWKFQALAAEAIANFAGIKFTFEDLSDYRLCLAGAEGREIFFGRDEMLLGALATGARSAVGSTYNIFPHIYQKMIAAWDAGDIDTARERQLDASRLVAAAVETGAALPALKAMLAFAGPDCGPCRNPLGTLGTADIATLHQALAQANASM